MFSFSKKNLSYNQLFMIAKFDETIFEILSRPLFISIY